ncbi:MAG: hypothetical protein ABI557_06580 [Aureliella sp.]
MNDARLSRSLLVALFFLLLAMCTVVGWIAFTGEDAPRQATLHAKFPGTMLQGTPGVERQIGVRWWGFAFGVLEIVFFVGCLMISLRPVKGRMRIFVSLGVLHVAAFVLMFIADYYYSVGELRLLILGFPLPTALMIYGVGGVPLAFILLYAFCFDRLILTSDDLAKMDRIVREQRQKFEAHQ